METLDLILKILQYDVAGNTVQAYAISAVTFIVLLFVLHLFKSVVLRRLGKLAGRTSINMMSELISILRGIGHPFYACTSFYIATAHLSLPSIFHKVVLGAFLITVVYEVIRILEKILEIAIVKFWFQKEDDQVSSIVGLVLKIILWSVGLLMVLSNLGIDITSLIASLGIGGIAIALAVQNVLGDIFSSFSIYFDEPFKIGDFIVVGEHKGTVQKIGLKTTRIQALQGEEIVISNAELISARVQNFKKMQRRRIVFTIGVEYGTPLEKLKAIPVMISSIIDTVENVECSRVHFYEFADYSLNFEVVYFTLTGDYHDYMNSRQEINLSIVETFEKEGISMAFPTQTVHVVKGS